MSSTSVSPLPSSAFLAHSHKHSKKRSKQLHASPPLSRLPHFLTHSLSGVNMQNISPLGFGCVAALPLNCYFSPFVFLSVASPPASSVCTPRFRERKEGWGGGALEGACVWRGKSGHVGLGERWRERGREEEEEGGGAGVCLQGCVMQPGKLSPCCDQHTDAHRKSRVQEGPTTHC